jgi:hypothetical protein
MEAPVEKKSKTGAIVGTIVAVVLCGCPGLVAACWGLASAIISFVPNANIDIGGSSNPNTALFVGIGSLCGGIIFIAIPVVVGLVTLRNKKPAAVPTTSDEPLPPAA